MPLPMLPKLLALMPLLMLMTQQNQQDHPLLFEWATALRPTIRKGKGLLVLAIQLIIKPLGQLVKQNMFQLSMPLLMMDKLDLLLHRNQPLLLSQPDRLLHAEPPPLFYYS